MNEGIINWKWRLYHKEVNILEKVAPFLCYRLYLELDELKGEINEMKAEADYYSSLRW
jgi:hypothetical protein